MTSFHTRTPLSSGMETTHRRARTHCVTPARMLSFLLILGAATAPAFAKAADDYYHAASYQYVAGKIQEASVEAEEGLRLHPGDTKLRMLAEHLRDLKDRQRGDQGSGNDQDKDGDPDRTEGKDRKDKGDQGGKPGDRDRDNEKGDQNENENRDGDGQDQPEDPRTPQDRNADRDDGASNAPQAGAPGAMSQEEAERLLNSFADDEKKEQGERRKVIRSRAGTEQDW